MKNLRTAAITALIFILSLQILRAQTKAPTVIHPYELEVTHLKTTNLVFEHSILGVDKGSNAILAQKAKGAENILQIKAGSEHFEETNLTVITSDGKLHSYLVNYAPYPKDLNFIFGKTDHGYQSAKTTGINEAILESTAAEVSLQPKTIKRKKDSKFDIGLVLDGLYIKEDVLYYQLRLSNSTNVSYDISQLRFFIRDRKKSKRTANQELELIPHYVHGNTNRIDANSESVLVFAMPKHTIPDKKYLAIQLMENNGGRHLSLKVGNKTLIKAAIAPE